MHTAIIKFNPLTDADRTGADDDRFLLWGSDGFIFGFVSTVEIRRGSIELRRAGVHHFINRSDIPFQPLFPDLFS